MAGAYAAIANDGVYIEPTFYTKVVDAEGNVILENEQETRTVMSSATAYIVKEILTEVVRSGAGWYTRISGMSVGVKTGTSNDDADRWFCGFTPYYTAATWYGYDNDNIRETVRASSYNPAGYIWDGVMETIHEGLDKKTFSQTRPSNVTTATICKASGKIATDICKADPRDNQVYTEYFVKGTVPKEKCSCHVQVNICKETGLLANEFCTDIETKVFITRPETETGNWSKAKDAEYMLTIKETCEVHKEPEPEPEREPEHESEPPTIEKPTEQPQKPQPEPEKPTEPQAPENEENTSAGNQTGDSSSGENESTGNTNSENTTNGGTTSGGTTDENTTTGGVVIQDDN